MENKELIEEIKRKVKDGEIEVENECSQICEEVFYLRDKRTGLQLEITDMYDKCRCSRCKRFIYEQDEQYRTWIADKKLFVCFDCETNKEKKEREIKEAKIIKHNKKLIKI